MQNLKNQQYNEESVEYCTVCHSLRIKEVGDTAYCDECGSTDIDNTNIKQWLEFSKIKNKIKDE